MIGKVKAGENKLSTEAKPAAASAALNRGRIYVLLAGLLWSLAGVFIKSLELHPPTIVFYRCSSYFTFQGIL